MSDLSQTTRLVSRLEGGDAEAAGALAPLVYDELRRIAGRLMQGERPDHTLEPTALLNEAYLRLVDVPARSESARAHFVGLAARAMRHVLVDHARARGAVKRGGDRGRVTLDERIPAALGVDELLAVDETLERLAAVDEELAQIVELRFFGGLSDPEIAQVLGRSLRSVQRAWRTARAFLASSIGEQDRSR